MRHRKKKKLKKGYDKDRRLLKSMIASLILYEKIETSAKRAKLVKSATEKLITLGKRDDLHSKRLLFSALPKNAALKVVEVLGPKYKDRKGGYTRLLRIGRAKDSTPRVRIDLV